MYVRVLITICAWGIMSFTHAQTCNTAITATAPDSRYTLQASGAEVKDNQTKLIWQRCSLGQSWGENVCSGNLAAYTWYEAMQEAKKNGQDWRIPNIKELQSLVENACSSPAVNETFFPQMASDDYWASTPSYNYGGNALVVWFGDGAIGERSKILKHYARLVRSSE